MRKGAIHLNYPGMIFNTKSSCIIAITLLLKGFESTIDTFYRSHKRTVTLGDSEPESLL